MTKRSTLRLALLVLLGLSFSVGAQAVSLLGVPADTNPNLPPISPGVTLTPLTGPMDGVPTGPLNGIVYQTIFAQHPGGSSGWVTSSYTITDPDDYLLFWEVSDAVDQVVDAAIAIDNIWLGGSLLFDFETLLPGPLAINSVGGLSGAIPNLAPTEGNSFGWLDTTGSTPAFFDTVTGTTGSQMTSASFSAVPGDVLTMDMAFLASDYLPFWDYGIAALYRVGASVPEAILWSADIADIGTATIPEPGTYLLFGLGAFGLLVWRRKRAA